MIFFAYDCQMAKFTEVTYTLWGFLGNGGVAGEDGGVAGEDGIMVGGGGLGHWRLRVLWHWNNGVD